MGSVSETTIRQGTVLDGKYRIDALVGLGGMGEVWRATQLSLGRSVAVKVLHQRYSVDQESRKRFVQEAKVTAAFVHVGAVSIFDFGEENGHLYLVMELLEGQTLKQFFDQADFVELHDFLEIALALLSTIEAAHDVSLVHRDLKPENIFVKKKKNLKNSFFCTKIVDFGLAFVASKDGQQSNVQSEEIKGTPHYLSPEQAIGKELSVASDIYSLGVIFFEILTGKLPYEGVTYELLKKHVNSPIPHIRSIQAQVPQNLNDLIYHMMSKDPQKRPTATQVREKIETLKNLRSMPNMSEEEVSCFFDFSDDDFSEITIVEPIIESTQSSMDFESEETILRFARLENNAFDTETMIDMVSQSDQLTTQMELSKSEEQKEVAILEKYFLEKLREPLSQFSIDSTNVITAQTKVVFTPGARIADIRKLVAANILVITDVFSSDTERMAALLSLGVYDLVTRPLNIEDIVQKIRKAIVHQNILEAV